MNVKWLKDTEGYFYCPVCAKAKAWELAAAGIKVEAE